MLTRQTAKQDDSYISPKTPAGGWGIKTSFQCPHYMTWFLIDCNEVIPFYQVTHIKWISKTTPCSVYIIAREL